jgi:hypothetical protein
VPFSLAFNVDPSGGFKVFTNIMDIFFLLDILISFNCGFYKKGILVMSRKEIILNYLKTWFIFDLLASFPYAWILDPNYFVFDGDYSTTNTNNNST